MDHDSAVGKGVGEKRVDGGGRTWRQSEGKLSVYGSKSNSVEPDDLVLCYVSLVISRRVGKERLT